MDELGRNSDKTAFDEPIDMSTDKCDVASTRRMFHKYMPDRVSTTAIAIAANTIKTLILPLRSSQVDVLSGY